MSQRVVGAVHEDMKAAYKYNLRSTPSLILDGRDIYETAIVSMNDTSSNDNLQTIYLSLSRTIS